MRDPTKALWAMDRPSTWRPPKWVRDSHTLNDLIWQRTRQPVTAAASGTTRRKRTAQQDEGERAALAPEPDGEGREEDEDQET